MHGLEPLSTRHNYTISTCPSQIRAVATFCSLYVLNLLFFRVVFQVNHWIISSLSAFFMHEFTWHPARGGRRFNSICLCLVVLGGRSDTFFREIAQVESVVSCSLDSCALYVARESALLEPKWSILFDLFDIYILCIEDNYHTPMHITKKKC